MSRGTVRARALAALAIGLALIIGAPVAASAAPITPAAFAAKIESALEVVRTAGSSVASQPVAADVALQVRTLLPLGLEVAEGTSTVTVTDNAAVHLLADRLRDAGSGSGRVTAAGNLTNHLVSMRAALGAQGTAPWDAGALQELLAKRPVTTDDSDMWLADRITELLEAITRWLESLDVELGGGRLFAPSRIIPALVIAIPVILALWVLIRALRRRRRRTGVTPEALVRPATGPVVAAAADLPDDPLSFADALAGEGRHRDAVRALYGGAARHLVHAGLVVHVRTRTNHEMLREVRAAAPELAPAFGRLTDEFEIAWYGHADPGDDGFAQARATYATLLASAAGGGDAT